MTRTDLAGRVRHARLADLSADNLASLHAGMDQVTPGGTLARRWTWASLSAVRPSASPPLLTPPRTPRRFLGFDVFAMIPPPSAKDRQAALTRHSRIASGISQGIGGEPL
jgi:hypothetical protein